MTTQGPGYLMYVSLQDDDRISIFRVDPGSGAVEHREDVAVAGGPAPLCMDPGAQVSLRGPPRLQ